jgi:GrpB-like predicted nucleotidyltransferase (UPF0157 family)
METLNERVRRVTAEPFEIVEYDPAWPAAYERERLHLLECFPQGSVIRIEHIGSTAVPGLAAKPIIDILVGVADLAVVREQVALLFEAEGYDYFWSPTHGDDGPPFYAFFIKRDSAGVRTHHIHVVEIGPPFAEHWDRVVFRDWLIAHPEVAAEYGRLKRRLAGDFAHDRIRYTDEKTAFIKAVTKQAKLEEGGRRHDCTDGCRRVPGECQ